MGWRYPQPDNEVEFEQQCLRLYRKVWRNENLQLYAKRGEKQNGIDIHDPLSISPVRAVQCKHHEPTKTITPAEIKSEVQKAENSNFPIEHYVIATTAKKSGNAQNMIVALNRRKKKKFTVQIHFWEEICQFASELGPIVAEHIVYGQNFLAGATSNQLPISGFAPALNSQDLDSDEPYATIERLINERQLVVAQHELSKLPPPDAVNSLDPRKKYKVLRLRAKYELESGEFEKAGNLFLEAFKTQPELPQAQQNQVLAMNLLGKCDKAYDLASKYIANGLATEVMVLRLIDSISTPEQLVKHASDFAKFLETDDSINASLAHKYLSFGDYKSALNAARKSLSIAPKSAHAHCAAAMSLHSLAVHGDPNLRLARLQSSLTHYADAEADARTHNFSGLLPEIFVNRASVRMLLGDLTGAESDYREAVKLAKHPAVYAEAVVRFFLQEEDFQAARELLHLLDRSTTEGQYLALVIECHNSDDGQKRKYFDQMKVLAEMDWEKAIECRFHCVQWAIDLNLTELAESCVSPRFQKDHPFQAHTILAWIRMIEKNRLGAKEETTKALEAGIHGAHPQEIRLLTSVLLKLGDDENALPFLEQLSMPGVLDEQMKMYLACAQRMDRHDLLLRLCRELREAGTIDEQVFKMELQLLSVYSPEIAFELADVFIRKSTTPAYFVAARNKLAVRLKRLDQVDLNPAALPTPAQLPLAEADLVLLPFVELNKYDEGLKFLYGHRRLYFDNEDAHGRYCFFFLTYGTKTTLREPPELVQKDCAVLLQVSENDLRWIVIEDEQPVASRYEVASGTRLAQSVLDHRVGDVIHLSVAFVNPEQATIREIQTKYVRAFQESLQNFQRLFPDTSILQQLHLGDGDSFDPTPIIDSLKGRQEHVEKCIEAYSSNACSIYLFAKSIGISEFDAIKSLSQQPHRTVQCCETTPQEFAQTVALGVPAEAFVLTVSAIITLTLADGWNHLNNTKRYLVSQLTSELIDSWIHNANESLAKESGMIGLDTENRLVFHETSEEYRNLNLRELQSMRQKVDAHCTTASSMCIAELLPEKRRLYNDVIGLHNVESAGVAKTQNATLWTDDLVVGLAGTTDFGVPSMWTQLAMRCFVDTSSLSMQDFDLITAKLASWGYTNIIWTPETIIAAGIAAEWNADRWPFRECISLISLPVLQISSKIQTVIGVLQRLRRSDCIELKQGAVIQSLLDALGEPSAVRWILSRVDALFLIDIISAEFVRQELAYWLRFR